MLLLTTLLLSLAARGSVCDDSWKQAYDAAFVRVKASGFFAEQASQAFPGLLSSLRTLADCPAMPDAFPFPEREPGSQLDMILYRGSVQFAAQFDVELMDSFADYASAGFNAGYKMMAEVAREVTRELAAAYAVDLSAEFQSYESSEATVRAVAEGDADATDMFHRQYTFLDGELKQVSTTKSCTVWLATISLSWNVTRDGWKNLDDIKAAGSAAVLPIYTTLQPFLDQARVLLPDAEILDRPGQNFEQDPSVYEEISLEFLRGDTTLFMAAKSDLQFVWGRLNRPEFDLDDILDVETNIVVPVGALLQRPPPITEVCDALAYGSYGEEV